VTGLGRVHMSSVAPLSSRPFPGQGLAPVDREHEKSTGRPLVLGYAVLSDEGRAHFSLDPRSRQPFRHVLGGAPEEPTCTPLAGLSAPYGLTRWRTMSPSTR